MAPSASAPVTQSVALSTTTATSANYTIASYSASATYPTATIATTLATTFSATPPAGAPTLQSVKRRPAAIGGSQIAGFAYLCITPAATTALNSLPSFALTVPSSSQSGLTYVALYNSGAAAAGWTTVEGPPTVSSTTLTFVPATMSPLPLQAGQTYCFAFFTVASALPSPSPSPSGSPSPTPLPMSQPEDVTVTTSTTGTATYATQAYAGTVTFPETTSGSATLHAVMAATLGQAEAQSGYVGERSGAGAGAYLCLTASSTVTLKTYPTFTLSVPAWYTSAGANALYVALANSVAGTTFVPIGGAAVPTAAGLVLSGPANGPTFISGQAYCFALYGVTTPLPSPSPVATTAAGLPAWNASQHTGYVAISYSGNPPQYIGIYAPGQTAPSTTITYNGCCLEQLQFDSNGNLLAATSDSGILEAAPGATTLSPFLPSQSGFSLGINASNTLAVGGYNTGSNVAVYPAESSAAQYTLPGQPFFASLAVSGTGEVAVPQLDGTVKTYPSASTTSNRTITIAGLEVNSINTAAVAYDTAGDLAIGGDSIGTVSVFAPGATAASYTVPGLSSAQGLVFDAFGRLIVAENDALVITSSGQTKVTLPNITPDYLNIGANGSFGYAGYNNPSQVFQNDGRVMTITTPYQSLGIAISP